MIEVNEKELLLHKKMGLSTILQKSVAVMFYVTILLSIMLRNMHSPISAATHWNDNLESHCLEH